MRKLIFVISVIISIFTVAVQAKGYEWVQPGEYTFGNCGRVNGGRVPTSIKAGEKYYTKFSCKSAYAHGDVCLQHARQIENLLKQYGTRSQCANWLNNELSSCRSLVNRAIKQCHQLSN